MKLPLFYHPGLTGQDSSAVLDEPTSKHVIQVLRMQQQEQLHLTNGKGHLFTARITDDNRKRTGLEIISAVQTDAPVKKVTIAISPVKNSSRFEWFLEKATEIGVSSIIPVMCTRTEKQHFKMERMQGILISALLQSQQSWMPQLQAPMKLADLLQHPFEGSRFVAHCEDASDKTQLIERSVKTDLHRTILVGPEGDFTHEEIQAALAAGYQPVALGNTRLRTETAGIVAATLLVNL